MSEHVDVDVDKLQSLRSLLSKDVENPTNFSEFSYGRRNAINQVLEVLNDVLPPDVVQREVIIKVTSSLNHDEWSEILDYIGPDIERRLPEYDSLVVVDRDTNTLIYDG